MPSPNNGMSAGGSDGGRRRGGGGTDKDSFHVVHKLPAGDSPYVRAKHLQLVDKDPDAAIVWFWKAINAGDRVESALKDMAVVMKQQDRAEEAVEAVKSFRHLCPKQSQESLDNVLIDLYKKCGKMEEQIDLLKQKLRKIYMGEAFHGKTTKTARSRGKKFKVSVQRESSRLLGNLGWAYMHQMNYLAAEAVYRKAQMIDPDANKACNLGLCLLRQGRLDEAWSVLEDVRHRRVPGSDDPRTADRTEELLREIESHSLGDCLDAEITERMEMLMNDWGGDDAVGKEGFGSNESRIPDLDEGPVWRDVQVQPVGYGFDDQSVGRVDLLMRHWTPFSNTYTIPISEGRGTDIKCMW